MNPLGGDAQPARAGTAEPNRAGVTTTARGSRSSAFPPPEEGLRSRRSTFDAADADAAARRAAASAFF